MTKNINPTADDMLGDRVTGGDMLKVHPAGKGFSSAQVGIFSLRRASYFDKTGFDKTGHGVRRADLAEAAIAEVAGALQQADRTRDHRTYFPRRSSDIATVKKVHIGNHD